MTSSAFNEDLISSIIKNVTSYDIRNWGPYPEVGKEFRRAAVLLPITVRDGEVFILLTKRSKHLRSHPSTVSFPGGVRDETDSSDIETALREAEEEIGLPPSCVQVIGILTRGVTVPNTVVYPVVGLIPNDFKPEVNPSEVEFAFFMPLKDFLNEDKVTYSSFTVKGRPFLSRAVMFEGDGAMTNVWGFTANYCTLLAKIVFNEKEYLQVFSDSKPSKVKGLYDDLIKYFNLVSSAAKQVKSKL